MTKRVYEQQIIEPLSFDKMVRSLRGFFMEKGYLETYPQPRLSILAACEDPKTVRSFNFAGDVWPLAQTNQVWLERDLLANPDVDGVYCLTTSYRDEPNPIEGRHNKIFPMWEAEHKGDFKHLLQTLSELVVYIGLADKVENIPFFTYLQLCEHYGVEVLESEHEEMMWKEFGDVVGITHFPQRTSPFWNMKQDGIDEKSGEQLYNKCDLIVCGQETFGSAERSSDSNQMRDNFHTISDGMYAKLLYNNFTKDRVEQELEDYLALIMVPRWGFGMGMTRLERAMKIKGLI